MASTENKRIIEIETRQEGTTLADLKIKVDEAAAALRKMEYDAAQLTEGGAQLVKRTDEYQNALVELKKAQGDYNTEMRISVKEASATKGSYNDLVNTLYRLKEEWKSAELGSDKFNELTEKVAKVKQELQDYDKTIGNFQRNVGNYGMEGMANVDAVNSKWAKMKEAAGKATEAVKGNTAAISALSPAAAGAVGKIQLLSGALKVLLLNPVVAVFTAIAGAVIAVSKAVKGNEEAWNKWQVALAPFKALGNAIATTLGDIASKLGDVALKASEASTKIMDSIPKWSEMSKGAQAALYALAPAVADLLKSMEEVNSASVTMAERRQAEIQIAKDEIKVRELQREVNLKNAQDELDASKMNLDAAKLEGKAKKDLLEQVDAKYEAIAKRNIDLAKQELALAEKKADQAPNDIAANDALVAARVKVMNAEKAYYDRAKEIAGQVVALEKTKADAHNKTAEAIQKQIEAVRKLAEEEGATLAALKSETEEIENEYNIRIALEQWQADQRKAIQDQEFADWIAQQDEQWEREQAMADAEKALLERRKKDTKDFASGVSSVLEGVAGAYESIVQAQIDSGKMSEAEGQKAFQRVKGVQYASAIINALLSANEAYSSLASIPYVGPALGAAAAAASLATGVATAGQIASTSIGGAASAASAAASTYQSVNTTAPITQEVVQTTRIVTNEQDTQAFADALGSQKVYVLQSDIEAANGAHKVAVTESSF